MRLIPILPAPQRLQLKVFTEKGQVSDNALIEQFHAWIQEDVLDEVVIDVADYSHVPDGPGILLVTHEADYAYDCVRGAGLRYVRKKSMPGSLDEAILQAYKQLVKAADKLEVSTARSSAPLSFKLHAIELAVLDRRLYPNTAETEEAVMKVLSPLFSPMTGDKELEITRLNEDSRYPLTLQVVIPQELTIDRILNAIQSHPSLVTPLAA